MNHLKRVRGQAPTRSMPRASYAAAGVVALFAGVHFGTNLAGGSGWMLSGDPIEAVEIHGTNRLAGIEVAAAAGLEARAPILSQSLGRLEERLEAHAWIAAARVLRLPGGRVVIDVDEREPAAVVAAGEPRQDYLIDVDGRPFATAEGLDPALPRIVWAAKAVVHEPHAELARAVGLARVVEARGLGRATEITITPDPDPIGFSLRLDGVAPRIVLGRDDFDSKLSELARLLAAAPAGLEAASELDLRFADQAVLRDERPPEEAAASDGGARMRAVVQTRG